MKFIDGMVSKMVTDYVLWFLFNHQLYYFLKKCLDQKFNKDKKLSMFTVVRYFLTFMIPINVLVLPILELFGIFSDEWRTLMMELLTPLGICLIVDLVYFQCYCAVEASYRKLKALGLFCAVCIVLCVIAYFFSDAIIVAGLYELIKFPFVVISLNFSEIVSMFFLYHSIWKLISSIIIYNTASEAYIENLKNEILSMGESKVRIKSLINDYEELLKTVENNSTEANDINETIRYLQSESNDSDEQSAKKLTEVEEMIAKRKTVPDLNTWSGYFFLGLIIAQCVYSLFRVCHFNYSFDPKKPDGIEDLVTKASFKYPIKFSKIIYKFVIYPIQNLFLWISESCKIDLYFRIIFFDILKINVFFSLISDYLPGWMVKYWMESGTPDAQMCHSLILHPDLVLWYLHAFLNFNWLRCGMNDFAKYYSMMRNRYSAKAAANFVLLMLKLLFFGKIFSMLKNQPVEKREFLQGALGNIDYPLLYTNVDVVKWYSQIPILVVFLYLMYLLLKNTQSAFKFRLAQFRSWL